jgi:hypothetical protein
MGKVQKLGFILLGLVIAFLALYYCNDYFLSTGLDPQWAVGYSVIVFLAVLGAR